jgi:hypothetical protein
MVVRPELDEGDEAAAGCEVGHGEGPARVEVAQQIAAGRPKLGESLEGIAGQPAVCRVCAGGRRTWMAEDEVAPRFDDLLLVGHEGELGLIAETARVAATSPRWAPRPKRVVTGCNTAGCSRGWRRRGFDLN